MVREKEINDNVVKMEIKPKDPNVIQGIKSEQLVHGKVKKNVTVDTSENCEARDLEFKYECNTCGKRFTALHALESHERIHVGKKPHICNVCRRTFLRNEHLKIHHQNVHEKAKLFECKICGKRFSSKGYVKIHEKIHNESKPFNRSSPYVTKSRPNSKSPISSKLMSINPTME